MKISCPKSKKHKRFITTAHEMHEWVVDELGNFVKDNGCLEVTVEPEKGNCFTCNVCGSEAKVE